MMLNRVVFVYEISMLGYFLLITNLYMWYEMKIEKKKFVLSIFSNELDGWVESIMDVIINACRVNYR
jgi:hypothetical protein